MSHYTVLVVTDKEPNEQILSDVLQPFHEFECTGTDDKYVVNRDITEEALANYAATESDEDRETLEQYIDGYYGYKFVDADSSPDLTVAHKYGYAHRQPDGSLKVIDRTNPNKKWDWWTVGGRWSGKFLNRSGESCDVVRKDNIDINAMQDAAEKRERDEHARIVEACPGINFHWMPWNEVREAHPGDIETARSVYSAQPEIVALKNARIWDCDDYLQPLEERVADARNRVCSSFAVIMEGEWIAKGRMGWWACVHDEQEDWPQTFQRVWERIRPDQWLTVVDCHI